MILSQLIIYNLAIILLSSSAVLNRNKANSPQLSNHINADSLHSLILNSSLDYKLIEEYSNYLLNYDIDLNNELRFLRNNGNNFSTNYLYAVTLKRLGRYEEMYKRLVSLLSQYPGFIPYYDDLLFAAQSTNNIALLRSLISEANIKPDYSTYLSALLYYAKGKYSDALPLLNNILVKDSTNKYILYRLSYTQRNLGNYVEALNFAKRSLKFCGTNNNFTCKIYLAMGSLYYLSGKFKSADEYYNKAYKLSLAQNNKYDESVALVDLAIMQDQKGDVQKARHNFNSSIAISDRYNFVEPKALAHSELGVSFTFTGELINARDNYLTSYKLFEMLGNRLRLSFLSDNLARLYMNEFNYRAAKVLYEKGLKYAGNNKKAQATNLVGLADVYANISNYAMALQYYEKARKVSAEIKDIPLEAEIISGIGTLNFNLNNFNSALKNYKRVNDLGISSGDQFLLLDTYRNLGLTYLQMDSLKPASINLLKAYEMSNSLSDIFTNVLCAIDLAHLLIQQGNYSKAFFYIKEAKTNSARYGLYYPLSLSYLLSGDIYDIKKNYKLAKDSFTEALKNIELLNEPNIRIELHYQLAKLEEREGNIKDAAYNYTAAMDIIEKISNSLYSKDDVQIAYFASKSQVYNSYAKLLLNERKYKEAFLVLDKSRSRNTNQNLLNLKIESMVTDKDFLNKLYDYQWIINSGLYNHAQVDSVNKIYDHEITAISKNFPSFKNHLSVKKGPAPIADIQAELSSGEYIISFFSSDDKTYSFLISRDNFKLFDTNISREKLLKMISDISPYFKSDSNSQNIFFNQDLFSFNSEASFKFYNELLVPVLKFVSANSKIIFSLSPELVTIPFEFMVTNYSPGTSPYNYSNKHFLIEDYQISYTPSVELYLNEKNNTLKNNGRTLIVGNPGISNNLSGFAARRGLLEESGGLPRGVALLPLKYSEEEVNEISSLIRADKILIENNATETNFKEYAQGSKIIHLSTHSFILNNQPVIFLSNVSDPDNDGLLEANEIVQLNLNSDLIVLSSCSSGLGHIDKSEGIVGMTKAFYEAGTKSVVVSLWQVNDKFTSKLMSLFYSYLSQSMNKSEALRQAKLKFIKQYSPNPYYWSAFILSGNTSDIEIKPAVHEYPIFLILSLIVIISIVIVLLRFSRRPLSM